jgi:AcrR family transcriptional regulator
MKLSKREQLHDDIRERIKDTARTQMAAEGTAALSLRAIAREMDVTAPALYRYFPGRDDLITALIVDAFNGLADAMAAAEAAQPRDDFRGRLLAALMAYRAWILQNPTDYQLIYGNPIPGYEGPRETTVPASQRSFEVIGLSLGEALAAGQWQPPAIYSAIPAQVEAHLLMILELVGYPIPPSVLYLVMMIWTRIHGLMTLEIFDHTPPVVGSSEHFYQFEITKLLDEIGLK